MIPLVFGLTIVAAVGAELPPLAQSAVSDYAKQKSAIIRKLNQDLLFKLRPLKGTMERSGDVQGAAAVQAKIDELEAEIKSLAEAATTAEPEAKSPARTGTLSVIVYAEENFKGNHVRLRVPFEISGPQDRRKFGITNDSVNSLKVPKGVEVILYDAELAGRSLKVTEDTPSLGSMRNTVSSLTARLVEGYPK